MNKCPQCNSSSLVVAATARLHFTPYAESDVTIIVASQPRLANRHLAQAAYVCPDCGYSVNAHSLRWHDGIPVEIIDRYPLYIRAFTKSPALPNLRPCQGGGNRRDQ